MSAAALKKEAPVLSEKLKNGIITLVSVIWGISMALSIYDSERYPMKPEANGAFTAVLAVVLITKKKDGNE